MKKNIQWSDEMLKEEALKFTTKKDFLYESNSAYQTAYRKGKNFLDSICSHMESLRIEWTDDMLREEALKYETRIDFVNNNYNAYTSTCRRGKDFLNKVCEHMSPQGSMYYRFVYIYLFSDNYFYVGLTCNMKRRHKEHLKSVKSVVFQHIKICSEYKYFIVEDTKVPVDNEIAVKLEEDFLQEYIEKGFFPLNKAKTGSLGGLYKKYSDEDIFQEAKKYKSRIEFKNSNSKIYQVACSREIIDEVCVHMESEYINWSDEILIIEAKKYKSRYEFQKNSNSAYQSARRRGKIFLDSICEHMESLRIEWTDDMLREEALKFTTKSDFAKKNPNAYRAVSSRGKKFLESVCVHMKIRQIFWTEEMIQTESLKFTNKSDFRINSNKAFQAMMYKGLTNKICAHMK